MRQSFAVYIFVYLLDVLYLILMYHIFQLSWLGSLVFRNLKPENVGFNIRDDIVLFDFGLAREIREEDRVTDHTWKLTGDTGSLRYMAPEVAQSKPYGENCV